ncbi:hypothetical protein EJB05_51009 [Eragrostis curvula]|uniref:RRM domain-containing protein n=1 Tax=Eragrostis curvula TaxID=38414 RepID=A0A5J9SWU8_9POAL|nr:hypothetical protein EJB05_51009 [Eragrostis curvula]
MVREAEPDAEQQQLLRRRRRLFAAEERSFRMDRRSPDAAALRAAVADVLPRFLYSDETLVEYIVVLVCNGKHQYQARDDLDAFLGDDTESFVTWLWGFLSKRTVASDGNCSFQDRLDNESEHLNGNKYLLAAKVHHGDSHMVNSKISVPQPSRDIHNPDSTKGRNVARPYISSTDAISPERLDGGQCFWEDQHHKKGQNAEGCRSFSMAQYGATGRTERILTQEEFDNGEHFGRNVSTRCLPEAVETNDERVPMSLKRRPVWDRLGKPVVEYRGLTRETHAISAQNGLYKKAKFVCEHEQRYCVDSNARHDMFDKANPRRLTNSYTDINIAQAHEHAGRANGSRLAGRLSFGGGSVFHGAVERNDQEREVRSQKSSLSMPVKSIRSQSLNESTAEMNDLPAVSEPTHNIFRSSKGHAMTSIKSPPLTMRRNSEAEVLLGDQVCSPALPKTPSSVREDGSSCRNNPVKAEDEILNMKLKIKQMELDVLKLRSKQMQITTEKQGALSLGPQANLEEDVDSRTVLVTNVHFAATKEALSMHFMKCGTVLKINILADAITGHPKGAACITFADKDSIEKAVSLNGTSFLTRVLTVMPKADAPPGFLASIQQTGSPLQPWSSPPFQKGSTPKQTSRYHLQWKREQSILEKSPAS